MKRIVSFAAAVFVIVALVAAPCLRAQTQGAQKPNKKSAGKKDKNKKVDPALLERSAAPTIKDALASLDSIHKTTLMYNSMEEALKEPEKVIRLNLSQRSLKAVPPEVAKLTNLVSLSLFGNDLVSLPPEFAALKNLQSLDLGNNYLAEFPKELAGLKSLKVLYLSSNQLAKLSPAIGKLSNLVTIDLSGNKLSDLPPEIGALNNLIELNIYMNRLETLPPTVGKMKRLMMVRIQDNPLTEKEASRLKVIMPHLDIRTKM